MGLFSFRPLGGFFCFNWGLFLVAGLRLKSFDIPQSGIVGGSVTLSCDWEVEESEELFGVKFYRDGLEFFRYIPDSKYGHGPQITTFPKDGVHPDKGETLEIHNNRIQFQLPNLELSSGGSFQCDVTTVPSFKRVLSEKKELSIMDLPKEPRIILSGFLHNAQLEDGWEGNCTFVASIPPADITFYLNNEELINSNDVELIPYKPEKVNGRFRSTTGLKLLVAPQHFRNGVLQLKCEAALFDKRWEFLRTIIRPSVEDSGENQVSSGESLSNRLGFLKPLPLLYSLVAVISLHLS